MNTRIRYQTVNGLLTLKTPLLAGSDLLIVTIDPKNLEAAIVSVNDHSVKGAVKGRNLSDLKKNVKNEFKNLGVSFNDEVRPGKVLNEELLKANDELLKHVNILLDNKTKGHVA